MLVDDDETVREAITELLGRKGWVVASFINAEAAINQLKIDPTGYDVVVTDINMPGIDGIDFLHLVREASPLIPVVMITGYPSIDVAVEAMKKGAADFLTKPFKSEELEIIIRKAVGEAKVVAPYGQHSGTGRAPLRAINQLPETARQRLEEKVKELSILHTIAETLDQLNEKDDIFRKVMDLAQIITGSVQSFILLHEHATNDLVIRAVSGYDDERLLGRRFSVDAEPFRTVIDTKSHTYVQVGRGELSLLVDDGRGREAGAPHTLMLAPMMINKAVVVMLGLVCKTERPVFLNEELTLLLNLTAKASLKLENIALSENIFTNIIGAIQSLLNALDARDTYTKEHSHRVTRYALTIAQMLKCTEDVMDSIRFAGPLHDIGKIGVRDEILLKKGALTMEENVLMMSHVLRGEEILRPLNLLDSEKAVVLYHHERWDGSGYPNGLAGAGIPIEARIFSVADTLDAMTTTRPYRTALSFDAAKAEIAKCSGSQFDPKVVKALVESDFLEGIEEH